MTQSASRKMKKSPVCNRLTAEPEKTTTAARYFAAILRFDQSYRHQTQ
jgi:hypothetical protein